MATISLFCNACGEENIKFTAYTNRRHIVYSSCGDCNSTDISVVELRDPLPPPPPLTDEQLRTFGGD